MYSKVHLVPQIAPEDVSDDDLTRVNDVVTSLVADVMRYLELQPKDETVTISHEETITEKELTQMLLLNIFNGCAMTYIGCETTKISKLNGKPSIVSGQPCIKYFTGSSYEGIGCATPEEYSDLDVMNVLQNFRASLCCDSNASNPTNQGLTSDSRNKTGNFPTADKESNVVTIYSLDTNSTTVHASDRFANIKDKLIDPPSDTKVKTVYTMKSEFPGYIKLLTDAVESELREITKSLNYGPVIRTSKTEILLAHKFEFDNAIAVECDGWPEEAHDWEHRQRPSKWPNASLIQKCREIPCCIVRKSHATNTEDLSEWRFSFAIQEAMLLRSLPVETKMIYILTKALLKATVLQEPLLTTYHLKTLFLWYLESNPDNDSNHNIDDNVKLFLKFVLKHINDHEVKNYFIPANNMISHVSKEDMRNMEKQIDGILTNFLASLRSIKTAYPYPFSTCRIAGKLLNETSTIFSCLAMIKCNFLNIIIDHLFSTHQPNWYVVGLYCHYFESLWECMSEENKRVDILETLKTLTATRTVLTQAYQIYGKSFAKLVMLYCCYIDQQMPDIASVSKRLLDELATLQDDLTKWSCSAAVTCTLSFQHGVRATESCCNLWKHILKPGEPVSSFFMFTIKTMLSGFDVDEGNEYLIGCLAATVNTLQIPNSDVEVGMVASLRLNWTIEPIILLASILEQVSMNGVLKQFIYLWVLNLETWLEKKEIPDEEDKIRGLDACRESKKALKAAGDLCKENLPKTDMHTFRFVVAIIVFQKLTLDNPNFELVERILGSLLSSNISKDFPETLEFEQDLAALTQAETVDPSSSFMFAVKYTHHCIISVGLDFALSVLDELTKPHFNLAILAMSSEALFCSGKLAESTAAVKTWIARATGAPVTQHPCLIIKMYGLLGHLCHIDALSENDPDQRTFIRKRADVMFKTALKEKESVQQLPVVINWLLHAWEQNDTDFSRYLRQVLESDDICSISQFYPHSAAVLNRMKELYKEVKSMESMKISSLIFAHYIAVQRGLELGPKKEKEESKVAINLSEHIGKIVKIIKSLEEMYAEMEKDGDTASTAKDVLIGSNIVLGLAACQLKMDGIAKDAFNRILILRPDCHLALEKIQEVSKNM